MARLAPSSLDRYRASLGSIQTLEPAVERELARSWQAGDRRAGDRLIRASLPFVIRIAREYVRWGVPVEDLVQQGNLGLLKAASKYDPEKGCRLVTYASYWIRAEIRDYVMRQYRIVRLGSTRTERRAIRAYRRQGIQSFEELAEVSGMPKTRAAMLWPLLVASDTSLDASYNEGTPAVTRVRDRSASPEELVGQARIRASVRDEMAAALGCLSERERTIVESRFIGDNPRTLEDLGNEMGVSKERVRQLEVRARRKLQGRLAKFQPAA